MTESAVTDDIPKQMQQIRRELVDDVEALADHARDLTDWRHYVKSHPWLCLGAAAALGYFVVPRGIRVVHPDAATLSELVQATKAEMDAKTQPSFLGGLGAALLSMATASLLQGGLAVVAQQMGDYLNPPADGAAPSDNNPRRNKP